MHIYKPIRDGRPYDVMFRLMVLGLGLVDICTLCTKYARKQIFAEGYMPTSEKSKVYSIPKNVPLQA